MGAHGHWLRCPAQSAILDSPSYQPKMVTTVVLASSRSVTPSQPSPTGAQPQCAQPLYRFHPHVHCQVEQFMLMVPAVWKEVIQNTWTQFDFSGEFVNRRVVLVCCCYCSHLLLVSVAPIHRWPINVWLKPNSHNKRLVRAGDFPHQVNQLNLCQRVNRQTKQCLSQLLIVIKKAESVLHFLKFLYLKKIW